MLLWLTSGHLQLGFLYIQDLSLYFHSTILSSPEMDKKFSCNLCSFEPHKSSNLEIHRKVHEKIGVAVVATMVVVVCVRVGARGVTVGHFRR